MIAALVDIVVLGLAVWHVVEVLHHAEISRFFRQLSDQAASGRYGRFAAFFGKAAECPFCLSHWVAGFFLLLSLTTIGKLLCALFAVVRVANLLNDVFYNYTRTPRANENDNPD